MAEFKFKPGKRAKIEAYILKWMDRYDTSKTNGNLYRQLFKTMSDEKLNEIISGDGIPFYAPVGGPVQVPTDHARDVLKEMGLPVSERIWLTNSKTGMTILTEHEHMVLPLITRPQTQSIIKKASIPEHNRRVDQYTHQVTGSGVSKASSMSFPEAYLLMAEGYEAAAKEFIQGRGGNLKLLRAIYAEIKATGKGSLEQSMLAATKSKAVTTLGTIYRAMHLGNNLE